MSQATVLLYSGILSVLFPSLAGAAFQFGFRDLGYGLVVSAVLSICVALLAYLDGPGEFQKVDLRSQRLRDEQARRNPFGG